MNTDELNTEDITAKGIIKILPQIVQQTVLALIEENTSQINEIREKYTLSVRSLNDGVLLEDINSLITFLNPRACEILNYTENELLGRHMNSIIPSEELNKFDRSINEHPEGINRTFQCNLLTRNGKRVPVFLTLVPLILSFLLNLLYQVEIQPKVCNKLSTNCTPCKTQYSLESWFSTSFKFP